MLAKQYSFFLSVFSLWPQGALAIFNLFIQSGCSSQNRVVSDGTKPTLKICNCNVGGIHNPIKRKKCLSFLKKEQVHSSYKKHTYLQMNT